MNTSDKILIPLMSTGHLTNLLKYLERKASPTMDDREKIQLCKDELQKRIELKNSLTQ